jgi:ankyrin repeat protein
VQYAWLSAWYLKLQETASMQGAQPINLDDVLVLLTQTGVDVNCRINCKVDAMHWQPAVIKEGPTLQHATALGLMVYCSHAEAIQQLVTQFSANVNAVSDDIGHTPVAQACAAGDFKTVKLLLCLGGDLHSSVAGSLQNPLHEAVAARSTERVLSC